MNDKTAEDTVEVVGDPQDVASDNLNNKVTKEKDEGDDSLPVVSEPRSVEIAEDERHITLVLLDAIVMLN